MRIRASLVIFVGEPYRFFEHVPFLQVAIRLGFANALENSVVKNRTTGYGKQFGPGPR
jgi:hypothetical protein